MKGFKPVIVAPLSTHLSLEWYANSSSGHAIDFQSRSRLGYSLRFVGISEATRLDDDWRPAILRRWTGLNTYCLPCLYCSRSDSPSGDL